MQWHQLDHMQTICTLLQTDNHTNTSSLSFLQVGCSSCHPTNSIKALKALKMQTKENCFFFLPDSVYYTHKLVLYAPLAVV